MSSKESSEFRTVRGYQLQNKLANQLTPALEDYLEMAYRLCMTENYTRVGRLSEKLHVKPSSASKMVYRLVEMGYLAYDQYDSIYLTKKGKEKGAYLLKRHDTIEEFLKMIGNTNPLVEVELVEHSLSRATIDKIEQLLDFFEANPDIVERYGNFKKRKQG